MFGENEKNAPEHRLPSVHFHNSGHPLSLVGQVDQDGGEEGHIGQHQQINGQQDAEGHGLLNEDAGPIFALLFYLPGVRATVWLT